MRIHSNKIANNSRIIEGKSTRCNQPSLQSVIQNCLIKKPMGSFAKITQFATQKEVFDIDGKTRSLFYDDTLGYYQSPQAQAGTQKGEKDEIAIMYETIATIDDAANCIERFQEKQSDIPNSLMGLSIIVNAPLDIIAKEQENNKATRVRTILDELARIPLTPNVNIEYDVWEKVSTEDTRKQVPYYSLRRRAAINSGAKKLFTELDKKANKVWRKMGDSDMPFHSPHDKNDEQIQKLSEEDYKYKEMITFGYNLSDSTQYILDRLAPYTLPYTLIIDHAKSIHHIIDMIYKKEMELRKYINFSYTIEPTTYYSMNNDEIAKLKLKPSSDTKQIREGETFEKQLMEGVQKSQHIFNYDIQEKTGSGGRNDHLIQFLNTKIQSNQIPDFTELKSEIEALNQSVFNPKTKKLDEFQVVEKNKLLTEIYTYTASIFRSWITQRIIAETNRRRYDQIDKIRGTNL